MSLLKHVFIIQLLWIAIGLTKAHSATSCSEVLSSAGLKVKLDDYFYRGDNSVRAINVSEEWIQTYHAVVETLENTDARKIFLHLLPGKKLKLKTAKEAILYETRDGALAFSEHLFHFTSPETAYKIIQGQVAMLTGGSHNSAAFCLGSPNFFNAIGKSGKNATFLRVVMKPNAKVLNLSKTLMGHPDPLGFSAQYDWYVEIFLNRLKQGLYSKIFPKLTTLAQASDNRFLYSLASKEIFGHLVGAEIILTSEKYSWQFLDEYWIIDPAKSVKSIQFEKGLTPLGGDRVGPV